MSRHPPDRTTGRPVIVLGAGGHAKVLVATLRRLNIPVIGCVVADPALETAAVLGAPILGGEDELARHDNASIDLVNGLGMLRPGSARMQLHGEWARRGWRFARVVDPTAVVGPEVEIGEGAQIMAGAVIQPGCRIGVSTIVNTRAGVDHDCRIGDHVHIAPGATLSGGVTVGDGSHLGTGCVVIEGLRIGRGCLIAAGAVVVADVADGATATGIPARPR
ncbi:MAG: acetyltransferase [Alphaproteobacteria bacterium]|nr:acetyltransferase [Alphaproteobacteria bacterium]MBF0128616.1 acetyltransferase [Alphaproteobacteria bacterium]